MAPDIPITELVECVAREIRFRKHVYERRVQERKMTQQKADYEIRCMEQIEVLLRQEAKKGELDLG